MIVKPAKKFNLSGLEDFGRIEIILENPPSIWDADDMIAKILEQLEILIFDPASDFIVWSGPTVFVTYMSIAIAKYMQESDLKYDNGYTALVYNTSSKKYQRVGVPSV